jgi:hypothetical protein
LYNHDYDDHDDDDDNINDIPEVMMKADRVLLSFGYNR